MDVELVLRLIYPSAVLTLKHRVWDPLLGDGGAQGEVRGRRVAHPGAALTRLQDLHLLAPPDLRPTPAGEEVRVDVAVAGCPEVFTELRHGLEHLPAAHAYNVGDLFIIALTICIIARRHVAPLDGHGGGDLLSLVIRSARAQPVP